MVRATFGELAVESGHTTAECVSDALLAQRRMARQGRTAFLAELLVERGAISAEQQHSLLEKGRGYCESARNGDAPPFGDVAVKKGYVSAADLYRALQLQRDEETATGSRRFVGDILVERGHISSWGLQDVLGAMRQAPPRGRPSDGAVFQARRYPRSIVHEARRVAPAVPSVRTFRLVGDIMSAAVMTVPQALLGQVLDALADEDARTALVCGGEALQGVLDLEDLRGMDRDVAVNLVMRAPGPTVLLETTIREVTRILTSSDLPCLAVLVGGIAIGVVTRGDLRLVGVSSEDLDETRLPYDELGVVD
jgi:CBS domain-containing protein